MSTDRDVERIVRSWMDEGVTALPDRVLDLVLDQIPATPQRRASWLARRFPPMSTFRIGIAAAVVVIAAIIGFNYVNSNVGSGEPTPTPTLTANPTATPVAIPPLPPNGAGTIVPGRYTIAVPNSLVVAAITVGDGWTTGGWYIMNPTLFNGFVAKQVSFWTVDNVYEDLCDRDSLPDPAVGPSVDDLVAALDAQANTDMSPAVEVELGGFAGKRVTMAAADTASLCLGFGEPESLTYFLVSGHPDGVQGRELSRNSMDTLWIIDVDGDRVVIATSQVDPEDTDATATIAGVMDSIEFEVP
jgi:hypothetical protein